MIDFLFFLFDTVTDFFWFKDDPGKVWKRALCRIGGSAVILLGILFMIPDAGSAHILGWGLIGAGLVLLIVVDGQLLKQRDN